LAINRVPFIGNFNLQFNNMTKKLFLLITLCSVYAFSNAQTNIGGTVNDYEAVSTFRSATQSVSVASSNAFSVGDLVLII